MKIKKITFDKLKSYVCLQECQFLEIIIDLAVNGFHWELRQLYLYFSEETLPVSPNRTEITAICNFHSASNLIPHNLQKIIRELPDTKLLIITYCLFVCAFVCVCVVGRVGWWLIQENVLSYSISLTFVLLLSCANMPSQIQQMLLTSDYCVNILRKHDKCCLCEFVLQLNFWAIWKKMENVIFVFLIICIF